MPKHQDRTSRTLRRSNASCTTAVCVTCTLRHRADLITIESGPRKRPWPRARLRRVGAHIWQLEMATHTGRWEPTPLRGLREQILIMLVDSQFGLDASLLLGLTRYEFRSAGTSRRLYTPTEPRRKLQRGLRPYWT